jgi:glycine/D-amino acid oxidase-like deaminating enzyme/nitrite reductase/ring-hydroxylating ferredoxin subunit
MQDSVWRDGLERAERPALLRDLEFDVVVVGGGITGLTTALLLDRAGERVAVLEAGRLGDGATGRTSAHLTQSLDQELSQLASRFGEEGMRQAVEASGAAIDLIESVVDDLGIDCDFRRVPTFRWAEEPAQADALRAEGDRYREAGVDVHWQEGLPFPSLAVGALRLERQAMFHPLRYLHGLADALEAGGRSKLFERSRVASWEAGQPCVVKTEAGRELRAKELVLATHSPVGLLLSLHTRLVPMKSFIIAARTDVEVPPGLYEDEADPYHYVRPAASDQPGLLVIGGADAKSGHEKDPEGHYARLEEFARARFGVLSVERRWSEVLFEPVDGLPYIGAMPATSHVWLGTGFSGNGLTWGTVTGMMLADLLQGKANPWADLLRPARLKPLASAKEFVKENADVAYRFVADRLARAPKEEEVGLAPGEGKLLSSHGKKLAVYRDEAGALHAMSPRCTHAGCLVQWNGADRTWDCPCHGGRFHADGHVLCGPPTARLERVEHETLAPPAIAEPRAPEVERPGEVG